MHDAEKFIQLPFGVVNDYTNLFHKSQNDETLNHLLALAEENHVPVVTPNVAYLLTLLVTIRQPHCILELGTAYGVSTFHIKKALTHPATFITIDLAEERQKVAKAFLEKTALLDDGMVFLCEDFRNDARLEALRKQYGLFDFIFIDAAKGQYAHLIETLAPLLSPSGLIVLDNIFLNGWIIQDSYPNHRQKTAFLRMKRFLEEIKCSDQFISTMLPLDDGVLILAKK